MLLTTRPGSFWVSSMTNARRTYTQAEELALTTQVGGLCPLCDDQLFYIKKNQSFKHYQLAHIYPLNPTPSEVTELKGAVLLHSDVNHPDNLIPLCVKCHSRLDKPRTREEYEELAQIKTELIERQSQRKLIREYPLEAEIRQVIARLNKMNSRKSTQQNCNSTRKALMKSLMPHYQ